MSTTPKKGTCNTSPTAENNPAPACPDLAMDTPPDSADVPFFSGPVDIRSITLTGLFLIAAFHTLYVARSKLFIEFKRKSPPTSSRSRSSIWGWLWGIPGALLAVPILATFKILCDQLEPLNGVGEFIGR